MCSIARRFPNDNGTGPVNWFSSSCILVRFSSLPTSSGMCPEKRLPLRSLQISTQNHFMKYIYSHRRRYFFLLLATSFEYDSMTCRAFFIVGSSVVGKHLYLRIDINSFTYFIIEDSWHCKASGHLHYFFDDSIIISTCYFVILT